MNIDEVRRIAALAHLHLEAHELARMGAEMTTILGYIDQLRQADAGAGTAETAAITPLREDSVAPSLDPSAVEANAPAFIDGHFVVPRIIG